ncbi:hypothetical protein ONA91_40800 [Micromonospora sp. DR5-3]|uniref:hypothetical protein n=1 Tax=unclassified Micromonospora TaxID=2617518 RepID=UPI0016529520|nr:MULTISPECIES: hypothetical protein [unclassified Micromonospora]MCW3820784.1 hypothetical protein [Micromonospora sp. DR5-3]
MLIVTGWPLAPDAGAPVEFLARGRAMLLPGGCLAVLLAHVDPVLPVDVVIAGKQAGLSYLQHIVAADQPPTRGQRTQLDIHTDVLVFARATVPESSGKLMGSRREPKGSSAQSRYRGSGGSR